MCGIAEVTRTASVPINHGFHSIGWEQSELIQVKKIRDAKVDEFDGDEYSGLISCHLWTMVVGVHELRSVYPSLGRAIAAKFKPPCGASASFSSSKALPSQTQAQLLAVINDHFRR